MTSYVERYDSTFDFIHVCKVGRKQRLKTLAEILQFKESSLNPFKENILLISDFLKKIDVKCHKNRADYTALSQTFHLSLSSDLRALIILAITRQNFQMNIVLRHFIEFFIVSLWIDIGSQFTGGFDYYLESEKWKRYWNHHKHRIDWQTIQARLEKIRVLNNKKKKNFYMTYFKTANEYDFQLLLSLPICSQCKQEKPEVYYRIYTVNLIKRMKTQKVVRGAYYKSGFQYNCHFCKQAKIIKGYVMGLVEMNDMINMLKTVIARQDLISNIDILEKVYDYLSREFVHFGTKAVPDIEPDLVVLVKGTIRLWGLEAVAFCLRQLYPLINYYFRQFNREQK